MNKLENSPFRGVHNVGATLSFACAVHCMATPFLLGVLPVLGLDFLADERIEWTLLVLALLLAVMSSVGGVRTHGRWAILLGFGVGVAFIFVGHFTKGGTHGIAIGLGGLVLSASQIMNRRWSHGCASCPHERAKVKGLKAPVT